MATYDSLSDEDKAVVQNATNVLRSLASEVAKALNHVAAVQADANAIGVFNTLDAGEAIPNTSGLAGADSMTQSELAAMYADFVAFRASHDTKANRERWTKAAGIANMIG